MDQAARKLPESTANRKASGGAGDIYGGAAGGWRCQIPASSRTGVRKSRQPESEGSDCEEENLDKMMRIKSYRVLRDWDADACPRISERTINNIAQQLEIPYGGVRHVDQVLYLAYLGPKLYSQLKLLVDDDLSPGYSSGTDDLDIESVDDTIEQSSIAGGGATSSTNFQTVQNPMVSSDSPTYMNNLNKPSTQELDSGDHGVPRTPDTGIISSQQNLQQVVPEINTDQVFAKFSKKYEAVVLAVCLESDPPIVPEETHLFPLKFFAECDVKSPDAYDVLGYFHERQEKFLALVPVFFKYKPENAKTLSSKLHNDPSFKRKHYSSTDETDSSEDLRKLT